MYVTQGFPARVNISKVNIIGIELTRYHQRGRGERRGLTIVGWRQQQTRRQRRSRQI